MKYLLSTLFCISTFIGFSQDYPRIEKDSLGRKLVVMTYEQAQKVDNSFELLSLLEKKGLECDSLNLSYIKVISNLESQTRLLETNITLYKSQIVDKDAQILNLNQRLKNSESNISKCDQQISTRDGQIDLLKEEIQTLKTKRNIAYGAGIVGILGGILLVLVFN